MSAFNEIPPTAGFAVYAREIIQALSRRHGPDCLQDDFKAYLNLPYAKITYSGTAALYFILEALKELTPKKTIIIPGLVCPLVPLAAQRAGFKVKVCDINQADFSFDRAQLYRICSVEQDIAAVIAVHLAGIPIDMEAIKEITAGKNIFTVEDCAQSLGAVFQGRPTGALSDFSFFSLCRGKGLTIYEGGVIATTHQEYAQLLDKTIARLAKDELLSEALKILELFGYWLFYRRILFWFIGRLPHIYWEVRKDPIGSLGEYFTADFGLHKVSGLRKKFGHILFKRLKPEIERQREKAAYYLAALKDVDGLRAITEKPGDKATYPCLALLFDSRQRREKIAQKLMKKGLGISQSYARAITDYSYLKDMFSGQSAPNAAGLVSGHLTLSTSCFLKKRDMDYIIEGIKEGLRES